METTIETRLRKLRMPGMSACWQTWVETRQTSQLSLEDGMQLLLQAEEDTRRANRNARLVHNARFRYPACLEELTFDSQRGLERQQVMQLATCAYINDGQPVFITGPAGTGKSWVATALGRQACMLGHKVRYFGTLKLFEHIALARATASVHRCFDQLAATDLIILDDFGLQRLDSQQMLDFMELVEDRHGRKSTIIVSQVPVSDWYEILSANTTAADAILDRLVHSANRITLKGGSLRK
jgi:DNA replication protein DnaC